MTQPLAGWYPDPSGDSSKLRYWDGSQWTDSFMDNPQAAPSTQAAQPEQPYAQSSQQPYAQQATTQPVYVAAGNPTYPMTKEDQTMRLIAFIFCLVTCVTIGWALIPLAWCIPMTVRAYGIWKGTKPNTTAFGVCTLIFVSLVSGILLLVSEKNE